MSDLDIELLRHMRRLSVVAAFDVAPFMTNSNAIEGEPGLNPNDLVAARAFLDGPLTEKSLLACHGSLTEPRGVEWGGRYRDCNVRVGNYLAPSYVEVPRLMKAFWRALPKLDAWEGHNRFQKIHPFEDLNGRTGRLIWLHKALDEGYTGQIGFLHRYYYETLSRVK